MRNTCADNLRQIGTGYATYAEAYNGQLPFAGVMPPGASWVRMPGGNVRTPTNSQNTYRLIRERFVTPQLFVDPSRPHDFPVPANAIQNTDDFPDPRNNSYSPLLLTSPLNRNQMEPGTPVDGDMTPLLDAQRQLLPPGRASVNSDSHGRSAGQNVLRIDLSVQFSRTPTVGLEHDDIYRVFGVEQYTGLERPMLKTDAFLIP
jgi:hypothetical protein